MYRFIKILNILYTFNIFKTAYIYLQTFNFKSEIFAFEIKFGI